MKKLLLFVGFLCAVQVQAQQFNVSLTRRVNVMDNIDQFHRYGAYLYCSRVVNPPIMQPIFNFLAKTVYRLDLIRYDSLFKERKILSFDAGKRGLNGFEPIVHFGKDAIYVVYFNCNDNINVNIHVAKIEPQNMTIAADIRLFTYPYKNSQLRSISKTLLSIKTVFHPIAGGQQAWIVHAIPGHLISCVVDSNLNLIEKATDITTPMPSMQTTAVCMDKQGNRAIAYRYDSAGHPQLQASGLYYQPAHGHGTFTEINLQKGLAGNVSLLLSKNGNNIIAGGDYFDYNTTYGAQGVFLGKIDFNEKSLTAIRLHPYTTELKQRVLHLGYAKQSEEHIVLQDRRMNYIINEMDDGTMVLSNHMTMSSIHGILMTSNTMYRFERYGPIVHVFARPDGSAHMTLIPKRQVRSTFAESFSFVRNNKLYCIYANVPRQHHEELADHQISLVKRHRRLIPVVNVYDAAGNLLQKTALIEERSTMMGNAMIGNISRLGEHELILPIGKYRSNVTFFSKMRQIGYVHMLD